MTITKRAKIEPRGDLKMAAQPGQDDVDAVEEELERHEHDDQVLPEQDPEEADGRK